MNTQNTHNNCIRIRGIHEEDGVTKCPHHHPGAAFVLQLLLLACEGHAATSSTSQRADDGARAKLHYCRGRSLEVAKTVNTHPCILSVLSLSVPLIANRRWTRPTTCELQSQYRGSNRRSEERQSRGGALEMR